MLSITILVLNTVSALIFPAISVITPDKAIRLSDPLPDMPLKDNSYLYTPSLLVRYAKFLVVGDIVVEPVFIVKSLAVNVPESIPLSASVILSGIVMLALELINCEATLPLRARIGLVLSIQVTSITS